MPLSTNRADFSRRYSGPESHQPLTIEEGCSLDSWMAGHAEARYGQVSLGLPVAFMSTRHVTEYTVGQVLEQLRFAGMEAKVIDEPLRGPAGGLLRFLAFKMAVPTVRLMLRVAGSHHSPEETVFYLARRRN